MNRIILVAGVIIVLLVVIFLIQGKGAFEPTIDPGGGGATKTLDLSNKGLEIVPSYVFSQTNLEELNISNNLLTGAISAEIRRLSSLKVLNASNNLMTGVPAEIGQLQNLEILDLSNNKLTGLPNELGNLTKLKTFNISGNQYSQQDLEYIRSKLPSSVNIIIN
ncbi:MAG: leucine-rich repeat domain-containing protein [Candidatus Staskawiczbacteria bacterium]|jgi:Leucine-rich repeat (LRR) protein